MNVEARAKPAQDAALAQPWWRGATIYQIYPRSFADSNRDGVGDLLGVTGRLDYIASLGVDAIWLSPFFKSPMRDFGYDVADYCDVDPIFGTLDDFDRLIEEARRRSLKVIIDQVYSHTSDQHAWFQESRCDRRNKRADWYVWADPKPDGSPPNNWQAVFGGPSWTWDARRGQYYLHNFLPSQPDLNLHNEAVQEAILEVMRFWLERGVDGFRLDAVNFMMHDPALRDNPPVKSPPARASRPFDFQHHIHNQSHPEIPAFLARLRALADTYGERFLLAEVGGELSHYEMKLYTQDDDRLHSAYGFQYLYADDLSADLVRSAAESWPGGSGEGWPAWTFSNHDAPRAVSRWAKGRDLQALARLNLLLLTSLRGSAILYQGEELGLPQAEVPFERLQDPEAIINWPLTLGRDGARTPIPWRRGAAHAGFSDAEPWLPLDPRHDALAVDIQEPDPQSTLNAARRILRLRQDLPALRVGDVTLLDTPGELVAFQRGHGAEAVLCAFNLGFDAAAWTLPPGWRVVEAVNDGGLVGALAPLEGLVAARA